MCERRDIQTVDARAVFRIAVAVRRIAPCRDSAGMGTVV